MKRLDINTIKKFIPENSGVNSVCWTYSPSAVTHYKFWMSKDGLDCNRMDFYYIVATTHPTQWVRDYALKCLKIFIIKKNTNYYVSRCLFPSKSCRK